MKLSREHEYSLNSIRLLLRNLAALCFFIQILLNFNYENLVCNVLSLVIFIICTETVFTEKNKNIADALIAIVIFLIIMSNSLVPMLGTLMDGHTLTYTLSTPIETFLHRFIYGLILILSFVIRPKKSNNFFKEIFSKLSDKYRLNTLLSEKTVWGLGLISIVFFLFKIILPIPIEVLKLLDGFGFLIYAPFILALPIYISETDQKPKRRKLLLYYVLMVILSFLTNSRQVLVNPIASFAGGWLILLLTGDVIISGKLVVKTFYIGIAAVFLAGFFSDLSTAIIIQRANRNVNTVEEQISATVKTFFDKDELDDYQISASANLLALEGTNVWQENYLRNPFLARFVQIKFDDNLLVKQAGYSESDRQKLRAATSDRILATFPTPILKLFSIEIDKDYVNSFSLSDYMNVLSGSGFLGNFLTGSITAFSYAIFGWWYPLILCCVYYLLFSIYAGFVSHSSELKTKENVSSIALILCFTLFISLSMDGVANLIPVMIREVWQTMLIYYLAIWILKKFGIK